MWCLVWKQPAGAMTTGGMAMRRTVVLPLLSAILLLTLALPAAALSGGPRLYAVASFAVKPVTIANITGDGSARLGQMKSRGGAIHWSAWTTRYVDRYLLQHFSGRYFTWMRL